ncbi:hypothetical protein ACOSP7_029122 [Xanthoceras sorbifolium]
MKKQDEQIGVEMVEGKVRALIDLDSSVMVEILEEEKGVKADVSGVVEITQSSVPAIYRSTAIVGIDKGSVLSSNSVDVSSHHLEAEGADLNMAWSALFCSFTDSTSSLLPPAAPTIKDPAVTASVVAAPASVVVVPVVTASAVAVLTIAAPAVAVPAVAAPVVAAPASCHVSSVDVASLFSTVGLFSLASSTGSGSFKCLPPQLGHFKLNVDAILNSADGYFKVDAAIRNNLSSLVVVKGSFFQRSVNQERLSVPRFDLGRRRSSHDEGEAEPPLRNQ